MKNVMKIAAISTIVAAAGMANAGGQYTTVNNAPAGAANNPEGPFSRREIHLTKLVEAIATGAAPANAATTLGINEALAGSTTDAFGRMVYSFGNGTTARRVFDRHTTASSAQQTLNLFSGSNANSTDQTWQDGVVELDVRARYSSGSQTLGFVRNANNAATTLLTIGGTAFANWFQFNDPSIATSVFVGPGDFRWTRNGSMTSRESDNGRDRMVAWEITGIPGQRSYVIGFEDGDDNDYNDLVVQVIVAIPLPTGAAMGMAGMGLLAIRRRSAR